MPFLADPVLSDLESYLCLECMVFGSVAHANVKMLGPVSKSQLG